MDQRARSRGAPDCSRRALRRQVGRRSRGTCRAVRDTRSSPRRGRRRRGRRARGASARGFGAHHGAEAAADPVAGDRATDAAADDVGDARRTVGAGGSAGHGRGLLGGGAHRPRVRGTRHGLEHARSGRQAVAALGPTPTDRGATRARPHAETEAVLLLPLPVVRLKRPLHAWPPRTPGPREWALGAARHRCAWYSAPGRSRRSPGTGAPGRRTVQCTGRRRGAAIRPVRAVDLGNTPLGAPFSGPRGVDRAPNDPLWASRRHW